MIFEIDKFKFEEGQNVNMKFSNGFYINLICNDEFTSIIRYGFIDQAQKTETVDNTKAEQFVQQLILQNVKAHDAKVVSVTNTKGKKSKFQSIMETLI